MFYLTYLHRELRRRLGRTVLTVLGLAVGVSLVVVVSALSTGLDRAQSKILNPLAKVGTDLVVSRPVDVPLAGAGSNTAVVGGVKDSEVDSLVDENQSLFQTDFSKLGKPGATFERELFLPATQLTFPDSEIAKIARLPGVDEVAGALTLLAVHQKGKVPEITSTVETGGKSITQTQDIPPPTQAEWTAISQCIQQSGGGPGCLPARFKRLSSVFTTPREVIKQVLNPPQTDLATEPYTAAGVDPARPGLGPHHPGADRDGTLSRPRHRRPRLCSARATPAGRAWRWGPRWCSTGRTTRSSAWPARRSVAHRPTCTCH